MQHEPERIIHSPAAISDPPAPVRAGAHRLHLLIVEGDPGPLTTLVPELEALGCVVRIAGDWPDTMRILQTERCNVVVAGRTGGPLDGIDLCRRVRGLERHVHVILVADREDEAAKTEALDAGADDLLQQPFSGVDLALAITSARRIVAMQQDLQVQNRALAAARAEADRQLEAVRHSLQAAAVLQRGLLPPPIRSGPFRLESLFMPSQEIGGDVLGAQQLPNGKLLFFNLDVAGHGVPAALEAFALHSRLAFPPPDTPERLALVADRLNAELLSRDGSSATLVIGLLDRDGMGVTLLRAGHPPPLLVPRHGDPRFLEVGGLPLGLFPLTKQPVVSLGMAPGDRLLIYSDGLTDGDGEAPSLGTSGLVAFWAEKKALPLTVAMAQFEATITRIAADQPPADDLSLMILECI